MIACRKSTKKGRWVDMNENLNKNLNENINTNKQTCNHNPNEKDTTLVKGDKYKMVNPLVVDFFCPCCKKVF